MKILVILSRVPYPLDKGDKLRAFHQIRHLSKNHEIVLCALNDSVLNKDAIKELKRYCIHVEIIRLSWAGIFVNIIKAMLNGRPMQVGYFYSGKAQKRINEVVAKYQPEHIYCQLIRTAEYIKEYSNIHKTLDYMDAFSKGMERRIPTAPFYLKPVFQIESQRLAKYEAEVFDLFETKIIISKQDRELINHPAKNDIRVIPNGVDAGYYRSITNSKQFDLLFTGNMAYPPNIDSVIYLVKKILPIVLKKRPGIKLLIAGTNPSEKVRSLKSANVCVSGWVEDIRECYENSKIFIAPMQIGIGMQNKLLEAMAMQLPCITSSLANNAIEAKDGESVLIAKNPHEYANHIIDLLENNERAKEIALNGYNFVVNKYNWDEVTGNLEKLITSTY